MKHALFDSMSLVVNPVPVTASASGELTTGIAIDRLGKRSGVVALKFGSLTGTPTAATVKLALKTCDTSDGAYEVLDAEHAVLGAAEQLLTADSTLIYRLDLTGQKRYVKIAPTVALTGGTSPSAALDGSALALGDADALPVG